MANAPGSKEAQVFLNACLLDGDSDLEKRTRRGKRRAILISIVLQLLFVAALILIPLLGKSENIARLVVYSPPVPIGRIGDRHRPRTPGNPHPRTPATYRTFAPTFLPQRVVTEDRTPPPIAEEPPQGDPIPGAPRISGVLGGSRNPGVHTEATPVEPQPLHPSKPAAVRRSEGVEAAMLIHRVQPVYPILCVQTRREGRVELHAIIGTDGSIQSLEVISGDPFFIPSALAAVREWRYRPTILNGQPVEVETVITVVYTLSH